MLRNNPLLMWRLLVLAIPTAVAACAPAGRPLTPNDISAYGTARFDAPPAKVFNAVQAALKSEGYEIASADLAKRTIKTDRKAIRAVAVGNEYSAQATTISRQYVIKLETEGGATVVAAEPRVFQGEADLSSRDVWDIDGPTGERALWQQLFRDTKEAL